MLIEHYDLKVYTPPCDPGAERFSAFAELAVDISEVLPYLNATLRGAIYHRSANALTWKKKRARDCISCVADRHQQRRRLRGRRRRNRQPDRARQSHLGTAGGDHTRLRDASTRTIDGGVSLAAADQLQAVRRTHLLFVCNQAGSLAKESRRLSAAV